jgi:hypothetical protein
MVARAVRNEPRCGDRWGRGCVRAAERRVETASARARRACRRGTRHRRACHGRDRDGSRLEQHRSRLLRLYEGNRAPARRALRAQPLRARQPRRAGAVRPVHRPREHGDGGHDQRAHLLPGAALGGARARGRRLARRPRAAGVPRRAAGRGRVGGSARRRSSTAPETRAASRAGERGRVSGAGADRDSSRGRGRR